MSSLEGPWSFQFSSLAHFAIRLRVQCLHYRIFRMAFYPGMLYGTPKETINQIRSRDIEATRVGIQV